MTVIVWDGITLATDRQLTNNGYKREERKIHCSADGREILMFCGAVDFGNELMLWYNEGRHKESWPEFQLNEDRWCTLVIGRQDGSVVCVYQQPVMIPVRSARTWGEQTARDVALGAMLMGACATKAIEVANSCCIACGFGYDAVRFENGFWKSVLR